MTLFAQRTRSDGGLGSASPPRSAPGPPFLPHSLGKGTRVAERPRTDGGLGSGIPPRPREERMADGADLGLQLLTRGTGREGVPARAGDDRVFVKGGVNLCLQVLLRGVVYRANETNKLSAWKLITPR